MQQWAFKSLQPVRNMVEGSEGNQPSVTRRVSAGSWKDSTF
jgi:hypothetical protein